jgi:hypothetical protein
MVDKRGLAIMFLMAFPDFISLLIISGTGSCSYNEIC